jgi:AcrR family transcriptional regulator
MRPAIPAKSAASLAANTTLLTAWQFNVSVTNMNSVSLSARKAGRPRLRVEQTQLTRARIETALAELLKEHGGVEGITFKSVAKKAGVTEMTVYRHYPTRADLLHSMWQQMNRELGPGVRMPETTQDLIAQHLEMFAGFDRIPAQITASITTPQGREMRASLNRKRRKAFLSIVAELAPDSDQVTRTRAAGVLQLLHSALAWFSLREQWGMSGAEAGRATQWAIELIFDKLRSRP